jgi:hypothetical protein
MDWRFDGKCLIGLDLRYALTVRLLEVGRVLSTRELVASIQSDGFVIVGRPSKTVSDALRWEVRRGRVVRRGRGIYAAGVVPRETKSRMIRRVSHLRYQVVARTWDTTSNDARTSAG